VDDFQAGVPVNWFTYGDWGSGAYYNTSAVLTNSLTAPLLVSDTVLKVDYNVAGWGVGGGRDLAPDDWSAYDGLSLWFYGADTGNTIRIVLSDNKSGPGDTAERFATTFEDDFSGWKHFILPWEVFYRDGWQPGGAPNDGLTLSEMWAYAVIPASGTGTFYLDQLKLFSDNGAAAASAPKASLSAAAYNVEEGGTAPITVTLNVTSTQYITVSYIMTDGTAIAGVDYLNTSGNLVYPPGELTQVFNVTTIDNSVYSANKTVLLEIADPVNATLGFPHNATLTILENEQSPQPLIAPENIWVLDNFESGLPSGTDEYGNPVGFVTWGSANNTFISTLPVSETYPLALPIWLDNNHLLQVDYDIAGGGWGGFSRLFTNEAADTWLSQDWTSYLGVSFWVYGTASGGDINIDIFDNRTTTGDSCERFTYIFSDNFTGWQYIEVPFTNFVRKGYQPPGAPDDGLTLTEMWGYAFGFPAGVGAHTNYIENTGLMMRTTVVDDYATGLPTGIDGFGNAIGFMTWGSAVNTFLTTTQVISTSPLAFPLPLGGNNFLQVDYDIAAGGWGGFTHLFTNDAVDTWVSQNWVTYQGISFWVHGTNSGGAINIDIFDNKTTTGDSCERWTYIFTDNFTGWRYFPIAFSDFTRKGWQPGGAPDDGLTLTEVWGYAFGFPAAVGARTNYLELVTTYGSTTPPFVEPAVGYGAMAYNVAEGDLLSITVKLNVAITYPVSVSYATTGGTATPDRDYLPVNGTFTFIPGEIEHTFAVLTLDDIKYEGNETIVLKLSDPISITLGSISKVDLTIQDNDPFDPLLIDDFETFPYGFNTWGGIDLSNLEVVTGTDMALPGQWTYENVLEVNSANDQRGFTPSGTGFSRTFFESEDWSSNNGLKFWYYGQNSGEALTVTVQDNRQPDPGPSGWTLVWNDEFDGSSGSPVNPANWTHEIGGEGWGNAEWEYYTDSTDNSSADGSGNLVITAREIPTGTAQLDCWYGDCTHTSARLVTAKKFEFAYGRAEARLKVPFGQGMWPAFWSLGNNFGSVSWPNCGELDIMENIGREPNIVHGTIHGPGYSGGNGIGGGYTLDSGNFADDFHIFAIEWEPTEIRWYVDGTQYLTTTIDDIPMGTEWVFDHPFFLIMNVAVGGYWPGYPDDSTIFPQTMTVDYVRVYQGPDTAERFDALFTDNFSGWKQVSLPFSAFDRSSEQPVGAPDDGLGLTEVWGYGFGLPSDFNPPVYLDQVALFNGAASLPAVQFTSTTYSVDEGGTVTITVQLDVSSSTPVTVAYTTANGTAIAGSDYLTSTGIIVFAPGEVSKSFQVVALADAAQEGDETILLALSNPEGAILGEIHEATLTIRDYVIPLIKVYLPLIYKQP
jgi:beta-glucanase (GH16 family)